ncbi:MAG: SPOR domain-containing protein [Methylovirgula sp.]|uniref:SPOR domain-containing protein n=1 Tax=Methylovirgula sp. TaxID=1978224 RepID=UPI0030761525
MFMRGLAGRGRTLILASFAASLLPALGSPAEAHHRHHLRHFAHSAHHARFRVASHRRHHEYAARHHGYAAGGGSSGLAEIVVDSNSGRVLYAQSENELRHPASITKVMTLYLLFKELDRGRLHLNSRLTVSAHAAAQAPTKLGLRPGQTIDVDSAIKAIVTKSANDMAVAIAEAIGGSEGNFCAMMTREAHSLGMSHTHYADASGLPNDAQITTAADLAILGRAIQERFPRYYHYFSLQEFAFHGQLIRNHNHLLGRIAGMDGIKTGYTRASGFNLLTSVHRDGRAIIAVVMGGATAASRDRAMAALIGREIQEASMRRTAPMIAEVVEERATARPQAADITKTSSWAEKAEALQAAEPVPMPVERPRPAYIASAPAASSDEDTSDTADATDAGDASDASDATTGSVNRVAFDGSTGRPEASSATPSNLHWVTGPAPAKIHKASAVIADSELAAAGIEVKPQAHEDDDASDAAQALPSGWMIQIGATDDADKAHALLARAKARGLSALDDAHAFTQKVQKGEATLYRARFAGLDEGDAQAVCRSLKRSGFACFAMKN